MGEFWETSFQKKKEMWGWTPADSAIEESIHADFGNYGLVDAKEISEPTKGGDKPSQRFWYIVCKKE